VSGGAGIIFALPHDLLDPFYKKKNAGAELPVQMDGLYGHTHFSVGLRAKK
jgi:hypothetical protein